MKQILFVLLCCLCLCGCTKEETTICQHDKDSVTIKHKDNKITFIKYEFVETFDSIADAIANQKETESDLNNLENDGFKWSIKRVDKTVYESLQSNNYSETYFDVLNKLEDIYDCVEQ